MRRYGRQSVTLTDDHVNEEILSYLPAGNLQSLKRVSKDWLRLISSPYFIRLHHSRAYPRRIRILIPLPDSIFEYNDYDPETKRMPYPPPMRGMGNILIMGSADGLICMFDRFGGNGVLFNPSTGKYSPLWPRNSPEFYGIKFFWFGKTAEGEYVLVMAVIRRYSLRPRYKLVVYKLRGLNLEGIQSKLFDFDVPHGERTLTGHYHIVERGTLVNGVLHWPIIRNFNHFMILVYHIEENKLWEMSPPAQCDFRLGVTLDGRLFTVVMNEVEGVFELWVMKDSWEKSANIEGFNIRSTELLSPLGFHSNGDLNLDVDGKKLMRYNFKDNRATLLVEYAFGNCAIDPIMCVDTLVSPSLSG